MDGELRFFYEVIEEQQIGIKKPLRTFHLFQKDRGGTPQNSLDEIAQGIRTNLFSGPDGNHIYDRVVLSTENNSCHLTVTRDGYRIRGPSISAVDDFSQIGKKYMELVKGRG